ncbi:MAG: thiamine pyrophosphate-dependent enzyme [Coriobacteriia bacterium]|nr:thiamine pyrophosphate-dependent enzyme [Coriobacteriia bacterium]MCL2536712.1 thiamine pyrophosphate-dependent enzyme [Coriobacteriia bacterium]
MPAPKDNEKVVFERTKGLTDTAFTYCAGCMHGTVHRLIGESLEALQVTGSTVGVAPVGCSVTATNFFNCDMVQASHGRAAAVATGIKRVNPNNIVFSYQGDGDLAAIGTAESVHAAARGEHITVIFINNAIYGMTGGQMAPTTMPGQITQTSPYGRIIAQDGYPLRVVEMLSTLDGVAYAERVSVDTPKNIRAAKRAVRKAFEYQRDKRGYSIVEVLCTCPTNWGLNPLDSADWMRKNMFPYYPLGVYRDIKAEGFENIVDAAAAKLEDQKAAYAAQVEAELAREIAKEERKASMKADIAEAADSKGGA